MSNADENGPDLDEQGDLKQLPIVDNPFDSEGNFRTTVAPRGPPTSATITTLAHRGRGRNRDAGNESTIDADEEVASRAGAGLQPKRPAHGLRKRLSRLGPGGEDTNSKSNLLGGSAYSDDDGDDGGATSAGEDDEDDENGEEVELGTGVRVTVVRQLMMVAPSSGGDTHYRDLSDSDGPDIEDIYGNLRGLNVYGAPRQQRRRRIDIDTAPAPAAPAPSQTHARLHEALGRQSSVHEVDLESNSLEQEIQQLLNLFGLRVLQILLPPADVAGIITSVEAISKVRVRKQMVLDDRWQLLIAARISTIRDSLQVIVAEHQDDVMEPAALASNPLQRTAAFGGHDATAAAAQTRVKYTSRLSDEALRPLRQAARALQDDVENAEIGTCTSVLDVIHFLQLATSSELTPFPDTRRAVRFMQRGVEIYLAIHDKESGDYLYECFLQLGDKLPLSDFDSLFRGLLSGAVAHARQESDMSAMDTLLADLLELRMRSMQQKEAFELLTSSVFIDLVRQLQAKAPGFVAFERAVVEKIAEYMNDTIIQKVNPYSYFARLCEVLAINFGQDPAVMKYFIRLLDYNLQSSRALAHIIFVTFMGADKAASIRNNRHNLPSTSLTRQFIDALVSERKLPYCHHADIVAGCKSRACDFARQHIVGCDATVMGGVMDKQEPGTFNVHAFFTVPFVLNAKLFKGTKRPITYLKILMLAANHAGVPEQLSQFDGEAREQMDAQCTELVVKVEKLLQLFEAVKAPRRWEIHNLITERLIEMARAWAGIDFSELLKKVLESFGHFLNMPEEELSFVISYVPQRGRDLDTYKDGFEALADAISGVTRGHPRGWSTSDISNRLFYIYCYAKYPLEDFKQWFIDANRTVGQKAGGVHEALSVSTMEGLFSNFSTKRRNLQGRAELETAGFRCLQHNQVAAVLSVAEKLDLGHVFLKVGTGQGKSVIIALLAMMLVKQGKRVQVFTCYKHLAARDFARFQPVFDKVGITKTFLIKDGYQDQVSGLPEDFQIVYSDMQTFYQAMQVSAKKRAQNQPETEEWKGYFVDPSNDIVILDEFDSLIMEHQQVCNTVYEFQGVAGISCSGLKFSSGSAFVKSFRKTNKLGRTFKQGVKDFELGGCGDKIIGGSGVWDEGSEGYDALGKKVRYTGGALWEMKNSGSWYSTCLQLDTLAHLRSFKHVIGLSGSISSEEIERFRSVFERTVTYVEIPPFYGPFAAVAKRNIQKADRRDLSRGAWLRALEEDIEMVARTGRPVLVFANPGVPQDWTDVADICKRVFGKLGEYARPRKPGYLEIKGEGDVNQQTLETSTKHFTITLSSHVAGRGADFSVQPDINEMGGLHVVISFEPKLSRYPSCCDARMIQQMKGRTARMDRNGSHSILTLAPALRKDPGNKIEIDKVDEEMYHISLAAFRALSGMPSFVEVVWRRWLIASYFMGKYSVYLNELPEKISYKTVEERDSNTGKTVKKRVPTSREEKASTVIKGLALNKTKTQSEACVIL